MVPEHMRSLPALRSEIFAHGMRLDHSRAAYWIGVAIGLGFSVPENVAMPMIAGSYHPVDLHAWTKAFDAWKGYCPNCKGEGNCLVCANS